MARDAPTEHIEAIFLYSTGSVSLKHARFGRIFEPWTYGEKSSAG